MSKSIPKTARRLSVLLKQRGFTKDNPFRPGAPVRVRQTLDMPGVLEFPEATVCAVWPDGKTIAIASEHNPPCTVVDEHEEYGDGNYIVSRWDLSALEKTLLFYIRPRPTSVALSSLLADAVPVGTLVLPAGTTARFRSPEGETEEYELLSVAVEDRQPLVRYRLRGEYFTDYGRDMSPEDLSEVLRVIGHPLD